MKCPVCKNEIATNEKPCRICGFTDFKEEFINQEDAIFWVNEILEPYKNRWETKQKIIPQSIAGIISQYEHQQMEMLSEAVTEEQTYYEYEKAAKGIILKKYNGLGEHVVIPAKIEETNVYKVGNRLFEGCKEIQSVFLEDSTVIIGEYAFKNCGSLHVVAFASTVTRIEEGAFYKCEALTKVKVDESVKSIGAGAFFECSGLKSIDLGKSLRQLGQGAFCGTEIEELMIPEGVSTIKEYLCSRCEKLQVVIALGVKTVEAGAFDDCKLLKKVVLSQKADCIDLRAFHGCMQMTQLLISKETKRIVIGEVPIRHIAVLNDQIEICEELTYGEDDDHCREYLSAETILYGNPGSTTYQYARKNKIIIKSLSEFPKEPRVL